MGIFEALWKDAFYAFLAPTEALKSMFGRKKTEESRLYNQTLRDVLSDYVNVNIFKSRKWHRDKYEMDKASLLTYMHSQGYRNARLRRDSVRYGKKGISIDMHYDMGRRHYIGDILWTGNYIYSDSALSRVLGLVRGDVYNPSLMERLLHFNPTGNDVSSLYQDRGYLYFRINPVELIVQGDTVDLEMRVFEGKEAKINRVFISGNTRTRDHVFLRELYTLPGAIFRRSDLIRSQQRLNQLGFVDAEKTMPVPIPKPETQEVDIEWKITERSSDQIELSGGWGGGVGLIGSVGFVLNNYSLRNTFKRSGWNPIPVGDGQKIAIRFRSNGRRFYSISTSFSEPWLGGRRRNNFSVAYNRSREQYLDASQNVDGSFLLNGFSVGLIQGLRFPDDYFSLGYTLSYRHYRLRNARLRSFSFRTGTSNNLSLLLSLGRNDVDHPIFPTRGAAISLSTELSVPYSLFVEGDVNDKVATERYQWVEYHKWLFDVKTYIPVVRNMAIETRFHTGLIGRYTPRGAVTPFELFTLGGNGLTGQNAILGTDVIGLRGYRNNAITPLDRANNISGGRLFNKMSIELRYKVLDATAGTIYILAFAEGGSNRNRIEEFSFFDLYRSVGVGVRALLPAIGLIGLDYGRALDTLPGELTPGSEFHLIIGQPNR